MLDLDVVRLGYAANLAIGVFLMGTAYVVASRLRIPGRGALAAYLALVGANYAFDAAATLHDVRDGRQLRDVAYLLGAFDPPLLASFAIAFAGWRVSPWARALLFAPSFLLVAHGLLIIPRTHITLGGVLYEVMIPMLVVYYALALAIVAHAHHRSRTGRERDLRAALLPLLALVVLPRLPLAFIDAHLVAGSGRTELASLLPLEGALLLTCAVAAGLFLWTAPPAARASTVRTIRNAAGLIGIVAAVWLLRVTPGFANASYALLYSVRWIVFAGVLSIDVHRQRLLGLPASLSRPARAWFTALLAFVGLVEITALLSAIPGSDPVLALVGGAASTAVIVVGGLAFSRRRMVDEEARVSKRRVYRAHLELGTPSERLAALRDELGLDVADAAEEERLVAAARAVPGDGFDRPEPGRSFAQRFEVERLLGSGAFGLVYAARDAITGRRVVLKELRPDWRASAEAVMRLRREAQLALRVAHPNLAPLVAVERAAGGDVLVFDHVDGETLAQRLSRGALTTDEATRLARDVLGALDALHAAGIVHRDIKPENIVLHPDGHAVLLDLGAAGDVRASATVLAGSAHPGTPSYMSPEQRAGRQLGPPSDLYALALVLREALGADAPAAWRAFLARALHEDPAARPADARAFAAALPA